MKKLIIIFLSILMPLMLATSVFAINYCLDFLEPGNPGGRITSLKTCDFVNPVTVNPGSTFTIEIWAANFPESLASSGFEIVYDPSQVSIVSVQAYDGVDIPDGPWDDTLTAKIPDADGNGVPGPYVLSVIQLACAVPDLGGDIIMARVTCQCLAQGSAIITFKGITGFNTTIGCLSSIIYDPQMGTQTITITQGQTTTTTTVVAADFCKGNFDYDKDVDGTDASTFKQSFGRSAFSNPCPTDGPAPVEKTWQSPSYAVGDDGYYHMGVSWTGNRFTDNGNGTVTDGLTGLIWLKNANCFAEETWNAALTACNTLSSGTCGLTDGSVPGDWRLPNVKELASLIDYDYYDPAIYWLHPFTDVQSNLYYWSSTNYAGSFGFAWVVGMGNGDVGAGAKSYDGIYVWPVRGGHPY